MALAEKKQAAQQVSLHILDREYIVACPPEEKEDLLQAADLLAERIQEARGRGNVIGSERVAVMAALNLAHEALSCRREREGYNSKISAGVERLKEKIEQALNNEEEAP